MKAALQDKLASLPEEPGVYLMKDEAGVVLYVGKAKNLRHRVLSYFAGCDGRYLLPFLAEAVSDLDAIVVANEKEALILENELIKLHKPRFNLKLKEGSNFVYLRLNLAETYPRLEVTRQVLKDGARYFGPYPAARALRQTLRVINQYFGLCTCADHDPQGHERPCLLCEISRFPGTLIRTFTPAEYRQQVADAIAFLEGRKPELLSSLKALMAAAAAAMSFEEAASLRDQIRAVERTLETQSIKIPAALDQDIIALEREGSQVGIYLLFVRKGLTRFGSLARLATAEREEIAAMLGPALAQRLYAYLHAPRPAAGGNEHVP